MARGISTSSCLILWDSHARTGAQTEYTVGFLRLTSPGGIFGMITTSDPGHVFQETQFLTPGARVLVEENIYLFSPQGHEALLGVFPLGWWSQDMDVLVGWFVCFEQLGGKFVYQGRV